MIMRWSRCAKVCKWQGKLPLDERQETQRNERDRKVKVCVSKIEKLLPENQQNEEGKVVKSVCFWRWTWEGAR